MKNIFIFTILAITIMSLGSYYIGTTSQATMEQQAKNLVTVDNFVRAETDNYFRINQVVNDAFGKFDHFRNVVPIDEQDVIRMNRDTLYSSAIFDLTTPVTITKPDAGDRFQSMLVINQDHYVKMIEHDAGTYTLTQEDMGTRYVVVTFRTLIDENKPGDIEEANKIQDKIISEQASKGTLDGLPDWDKKSLKEVRESLIKISSFSSSTKGAFGDEDEVDPLMHLLGTAYGWGGSPPAATTFILKTPEGNNIPYTLTIEDEVPVDGFWSVTVYNKEGFLEKNEYDAYLINDRNAVKDKNGNIVIHFGGDPTNTNFLPITNGWNYAVRLYQPRQEILDGSWTFPEAKKA